MISEIGWSMTKFLGLQVPVGPVILMYHRIGDTVDDAWGLTVSARHFTEHLQILRRHRTVLRLPELQQSLDKGSVPRDAAVVTFDDGYADNLYMAKPLLESHDVPATVFVTSGFVDYEREFWWDELETLLLRSGLLPETLRLTIANVNLRWMLGPSVRPNAHARTAHRPWRGWETPPTPRHEAFQSIWRLLRPMPNEARMQIINEIRVQIGVPAKPVPHRRGMSSTELAALADGDLVEIGGHTMTHPPLTEIPPTQRLNEIVMGKAFLEQKLDKPVASFSFPYGDHDDTTVILLREAGIKCACTTVEEAIRKAHDPLKLPRFQIEDWDGEAFSRWLATGHRP